MCIVHDLDGGRLCAIRVGDGIFEIRRRTAAFGTSSWFRAGNKPLLWVIRDVRGKDRMDSADKAISASHLDTFRTCLDERVQNVAHRFVKQSLATRSLLMSSEIGGVQFVRGKVADEDTCVLGRPSTDRTWYVTKSKIDWVSGFVARELSEMGLVCGDYDWSYSGFVG